MDGEARAAGRQGVKQRIHASTALQACAAKPLRHAAQIGRTAARLWRWQRSIAQPLSLHCCAEPTRRHPIRPGAVQLLAGRSPCTGHPCTSTSAQSESCAHACQHLHTQPCPRGRLFGSVGATRARWPVLRCGSCPPTLSGRPALLCGCCCWPGATSASAQTDVWGGTPLNPELKSRGKAGKGWRSAVSPPTSQLQLPVPSPACLLALVGRMAWVVTLPTLTVRGIDSATVTAFSPPVTLLMVGAGGLPGRTLGRGTAGEQQRLRLSKCTCGRRELAAK